MKISIIAALSKHTRVIGRDGSLPWKLSDDLAFFKAKTLSHHVLMGRKTYESIGRCLRDRHIIVVSSNKNYLGRGCEKVVYSIQEGIDYAESVGETELFVCGGGTIYSQVMDIVDVLYLTMVDAHVHGDVNFPSYDESSFNVMRTYRKYADVRNEFNFDILELERVK